MNFQFATSVIHELEICYIWIASGFNADITVMIFDPNIVNFILRSPDSVDKAQRAQEVHSDHKPTFADVVVVFDILTKTKWQIAVSWSFYAWKGQLLLVDAYRGKLLYTCTLSLCCLLFSLLHVYRNLCRIIDTCYALYLIKKYISKTFYCVLLIYYL